MRKPLLPLLLLLLGLSIQDCTLVSGPELVDFDDLENAILDEVDSNRIPSLAAWVVRGDSIVWQKHYGYADITSQRVADTNTIYGLASISKLVVVTAVMQLFDLGLIDLDADINMYLPFDVRNPEYPDKEITLHHLLTHTSGLNWPESDDEVPGYYQRYVLDASPPLGVWIPDFILPGGINYVPEVWLNSLPGEREWYSNIGTCVAAYIVEVISAIDFNEYCKQHIFTPLEMFNTSFAFADLNMTDVASMYDHPQHAIDFFRYQGYPAGELKTTIEDFSHFIIAYMNGGLYKSNRILAGSTVNEILEIQNPASGLCLIWNCALDDWYGHSGGKDGVAAHVEFQRDHNVALMVVSNYRHPTVYPGGKAHALVRRIARNHY